MKAIELVRKYLSDELILRKPIEKLHAKLNITPSCRNMQWGVTAPCDTQAAKLNLDPAWCLLSLAPWNCLVKLRTQHTIQCYFLWEIDQSILENVILNFTSSLYTYKEFKSSMWKKIKKNKNKKNKSSMCVKDLKLLYFFL